VSVVCRLSVYVCRLSFVVCRLLFVVLSFVVCIQKYTCFLFHYLPCLNLKREINFVPNPINPPIMNGIVSCSILIYFFFSPTNLIDFELWPFFSLHIENEIVLILYFFLRISFNFFFLKTKAFSPNPKAS